MQDTTPSAGAPNGEQDAVTRDVTQIWERIEALNAERLAQTEAKQQASVRTPQKRTECRLYAPIRYNLEYVPTGLHPSVSRAFWGVQWWLNDITHNEASLRRWCYLFGVNGCGKSHLCREARRVVKEAGKRSLLYSFADMVERLHASRGDSLGIYCNIPILFIDDIGKERAVGAGEEMVNAWLFQILDARADKWTFITSNLTPEQIGQRYDPAISSRLAASKVKHTIVDMSGADDYRVTKRRQPSPPYFNAF